MTDQQETQVQPDQGPAVQTPENPGDDKVLKVEGKEQQQYPKLSPPLVAAYAFGALFFLYIFLVGLNLMGTAFKVLGGKGAGNMYSAVENPLAGLMTGILSTVLVQSSSTSTSIVVTMVGADQITVKNGIPIIMGANIGTSVTNTIVSMGHLKNRIELQRAFSGATVHDMFNMLTVITLLPIEAIIAAMQGEGGPLYWLTYAFTNAAMKQEKGEALFKSPIKLITSPVAKLFLDSNKYVIYALTLEAPEAKTPTAVNETLCAGRRLTAETASNVSEASTGDKGSSRSLLSRRLGEGACKEYYCVGKDLDKNFKKISKSSYKKLSACGDLILDSEGSPCGKDKCYLDAGAYYDKKVTNGALVKGGFLKGAGDVGGGILALIFSILLLTAGMIGLTKLLSLIFMGNIQKILQYALKVNDYVAIVIGMLVTILVQSSSVTTSALTPLCGLGVLPLVKMLPLTLGANIGTTCTALIASLVSLKFGAVQIALVHLLFNISGILIWFPAPPMRRVPIQAAALLGLYASVYRFAPAIYLLVAFVAAPGIGLAISATFNASIGGGVVLLLFVIALISAFVFMWVHGYPLGGENALCYKVLSKEDRLKGAADLIEANKEVAGQIGGAAPESVSV